MNENFLKNNDKIIDIFFGEFESQKGVCVC